MATLISTESNAVIGPAFYNREFERKYFREKIENGEAVLLTGQRRMGKSSLARKVGRELVEDCNDDWMFLFVDIQACASGSELVARLAEVLQKQLGCKNFIMKWISSATKVISSVEEVSAGEVSIKVRESLNAGNWQAKGRTLLDRIQSLDKRTLLVLDEFPDVVNKVHRHEGAESVETLLDWLRPEIQATTPNKKLSIILSGSIGLEPVLQRMKMTVRINNLAVYRLAPWKREVAKSCLEALANYRKTRVDPEVFDYFLDQLGIFIPQHIQQCWARLQLNAKRGEISDNSLRC